MKLTWSYLIYLALALVIFTFTPFAQSAQPVHPLPPEPEQRTSPNPRQGPALLSAAQAEGPIRVIINLRESFTPEGALVRSGVDNVANSAVVRNQRARIALAKTTLLNQVTGPDLQVVSSLEGLPGLAAVADAAAIQRLLQSPLVSSVVEDTLNYPSMGYSLPFIHASSSGGAWDQGVDGNDFSVVILDNGAFTNHEFLSGKTVAEACFSSDNGVTNFSLCPGAATFASGPGAADPFARCTILTGDPEECTHGTHVAGTVAGNWGYYNAPSLVQPINMGGVARGA